MTSPRSKFHFALVALSLVLVRLSGQTAATDGSAADTPPSDNVVELPKFSVAGESDNNFSGKSAVSSTRIAAELIDIPQSVTVLNSSFMETVNPYTMMNILSYVGGGQPGQLIWNPGRMNMRGYTGDGDYLDGFIPSINGTPVVSQFYDRLEIIKGPSTVFLAADGSPGGIVNKISKNPQSQSQTSITLEYGHYNSGSLFIDTTGALTKNKKLLYRVIAGGTYIDDGFYDDFYNHRTAIMGALSYAFTPSTQITLKAMHARTRIGAYGGLPIDPRTLRVFDIGAQRSTLDDNGTQWKKDEYARVWSDFTSRLNDHVAVHVAGMLAIESIPLVQSIVQTWNEGQRRFTVTNYNGTQNFARSTTAQDRWFGYEDLQADLNFNFTLGPTKHNFLLGGELRHSPDVNTQWFGTSSAWNPYFPVTPSVTVDYNQVTNKVRTDSDATRFFAIETLKLFDDRLILLAGASNTRAKSSVFNIRTNTLTTPEFAVSKTLPQYGITYKVTPGVSIFYGYNENFALNGVGLINGVSQVLPPKSGKQSEFGIKTELLNKRLRINVAYFDIKQANNTVPSAPLDPLNPLVLIPGVVSKGFDGDWNFQVTKSFYLMGAFSYYKAKSILGPQAATFVQPYYNAIRTDWIPVSNNANQTLSLFGKYDFTRGRLRGLTVSLGANYLSERAVTDGANQVIFSFIPSRTLVTANFNYKLNKKATLRLGIENLLNTTYIEATRSQNVIIPGTPINVKGTIEYEF